MTASNRQATKPTGHRAGSRRVPLQSDRAAQLVARAGGRMARVAVEARLRRPGDPLAGRQAVGLALMRGVLEVDGDDVVIAERRAAA